MRRLASGALLLLFAGCALPDRDNEHDPAVSPAAKLAIVDVGGTPGSCAESAVRPAGGFHEVGSASRGACLGLDASASTDPQGDTLEYRFFAPDGTAISALEDTPDLALVPASVSLALPLGQSVEFRVEARDPGGARRIASRTVILTNTAPVVEEQLPLTLPLEGNPWDPALTAFSREIAATYSDADGDEAVDWCWTDTWLPDATPACTAGAGAHVHELPPLPAGVPARYVTAVTASDGNATSAVRTFSTIVRTPDVWGAVRSETGIAAVQQLDRRHTVGDASREVFDAAYLPGGDRLALVISTSGTGGVAIAFWPSGILAGVSTVPFTVKPIVDPASDRIWGLRRDPSTGSPIDVGYFDVSGTTLGPWTPSNATLSGTDSPYGRLLGTVDITGGLFFGAMGADRIWSVDDAASAAVEILASDARVFTGLSARPGTDEVWAVEAPMEDVVLVEAQIRRFRRITNGVQELPALKLDATLPFGWTWVRGDSAWVVLAGEGIALYSAADLPELDSALAAAPRFSVPALDAFDLVGDADLGGVWVRSASSATLYHASPDGQLSTFPVGLESEITPLFVDPAGLLWWRTSDSTNGTFLVSGLGPATSGISREIGVSAIAAAADRARGGVWIAHSTPHALQLLSEDGRVRESYQQLDLPSGTVLMPVFEALAIDPDGGAAWGIEDGVLLRVHDLAIGGTFSVPGIAIPVSTPVNTATVFEASAPLPSSTPFAWVGVNGNPTGAAPGIATVDEDGIVTRRESYGGVILPGYLSTAAGARLLASNSLCLAVYDHTPADGDSLSLRLVTASQAEGAGTSLASASSVSLAPAGVGATSDGGDACWMAWHSGGQLHVRAYPASGGPPIVSVDEPGVQICDFVAASRTEFWVIRDTSPAECAGHAERFTLGAAVPVWSSFAYAEAGSTDLLAP